MSTNNIRTFYIYFITNHINGNTYIGQRKCPINKTLENDNYMGSGSRLQLAKEKYGIENFSKEIIAVCHQKEIIDILEINYIELYRSIGKAEYNIAKGGNSGDFCYFSEESKRKKIESMKRFYKNKIWTEEEKERFRYWKGKHHTLEQIRKNSESHKGLNKYPKSEEHKRKISESLKGNIPGNKGMKMSKEFCEKQHLIKTELYSSEKGELTKQKLRQANLGKHHSEETKRKMSISSTGRKHSEETKKMLSEKFKGRTFSEDWLKHIRESRSSEEYRKKMSDIHKGRKFTDEHKQHIREAQKQFHWYTNGIKNVRAKECPDGFVPGRTL